MPDIFLHSSGLLEVSARGHLSYSIGGGGCEAFLFQKAFGSFERAISMFCALVIIFFKGNLVCGYLVYGIFF